MKFENNKKKKLSLIIIMILISSIFGTLVSFYALYTIGISKNILYWAAATFLVSLVLFFFITRHSFNFAHAYARIKSYIISYFDSIVLTFTYVSALILITDGIIYLANNLIGLSMHRSLFILLLYYMLEVSTLFWSLPFREYPTWKNRRSWPTLSILLSTPFALIYLSIRYRYIDFCKLEGIYITWMLTRYNVVNPIWLRPQEQTENYDSGLKGMLLELNKKPASHPIHSLS